MDSKHTAKNAIFLAEYCLCSHTLFGISHGQQVPHVLGMVHRGRDSFWINVLQSGSIKLIASSWLRRGAHATASFNMLHRMVRYSGRFMVHCFSLFFLFDNKGQVIVKAKTVPRKSTNIFQDFRVSRSFASLWRHPASPLAVIRRISRHPMRDFSTQKPENQCVSPLCSFIPLF